MGRPPKDVAGRKFGRLTALWLDHVSPVRGAYWVCCCQCGTAVLAALDQLREGGVRSCGCLWREAMRAGARSKSTTKLSRADIIRIRAAYEAGGVTYRELGRRYGVTGQAISDALTAAGLGSGMRRDLVRASSRARAGVKLSWDDVAGIKAAFGAGGISKRELGRRYGVSDMTIANVLKAEVPESAHG